MKNTTKSLIIAIASVAVLAGSFAAVYYLVPDQPDDLEGVKVSSDGTSSEEDHYHLMAYSTAEVKQIDVENEGGKYTLLAESKNGDSAAASDVLTDENVYTMVGFEKMKLEDGKPQTLAEDATGLTAGKLVNDGSKKSDFGFDKPSAVVKLTLKSGESKTITLGDDAPDNKGSYVMIEGDKNIYLSDADSVDGFKITKMGMFSTDIGTSLGDNSDEKFKKLVFGGKAFNGMTLKLGHNESAAFTEDYLVVEPDKVAANDKISSFIVSNIRYLIAQEVAAVDADEKTLKQYGLDEPYMTLQAEYSDLKVDYKATEPADGSFYLLSNKIIYKMDESAVPWISYTYNDYIPDLVLAPNYDAVSKINIEAEGKNYEFDIERTARSVRDDNADTDIETFTVKVTSGGKEIDEDIYTMFYNNLTSAKRNGLEDAPKDGKKVLTVEYTFSDGTSAKAEYFEGENRKCPVVINGTLGSMAYESYVSKILEDVKKASKNEEIKPIS